MFLITSYKLLPITTLIFIKQRFDEIESVSILLIIQVILHFWYDRSLGSLHHLTKQIKLAKIPSVVLIVITSVCLMRFPVTRCQ